MTPAAARLSTPQPQPHPKDEEADSLHLPIEQHPHNSHDNKDSQNEKEEEDKKKAAKLLAQATDILQAIDEAHGTQMVVDDGESPPKPHTHTHMIPRFSQSEIVVGDYLGEGGYGVVHTVAKILLSDSPAHSQETDKQQHNHPNPNDNREASMEEQSAAARQFMKHHCQRHDMARYAIKRNKYQDNGVHRSNQQEARGRIDLAVEAKYLSTVAVAQHPNIIKLRGLAYGPTLMEKDFFIIVDRLETTLDAKMLQWAKDQERILQSNAKKRKGLFGWLPRQRQQQQRKNQSNTAPHNITLQELLVQRLTVAFDLAKAFQHLHAHGVVYRDIKATNIGFDVRGDVKIFDLGFCKSLCRALQVNPDDASYGYRLTPRVGSFPYMAPEVFKRHPYNTKCDVFSFAVLLWELLSLQLAWTDYSPNEFVHHVLLQEERILPIASDWPPLTRLLISEAWHPLPTKRPNMSRIVNMIRSDLHDLTTDETVLRRTQHMKSRSQHSVEEEECWMGQL